MNKIYYYIITLPFILASCSNWNSDKFTPAKPSVVPEQSLPMMIWEENNKLSSQDFIEKETDDCEYIFLQSDNPKHIIGCINQVFATDSIITILDNSITEKILQFDRNGKYIQSIGAKGKARGEYLGLGCAFQNKDGNILVTDRLSGKIIEYSGDGKFINEYVMNMMMPQSMVMTDSVLLGSFAGYLKSSEFRLKWLDLSGEELNTAFPFTSTRQYVAGKLIVDNKGNIHYNFPLNDTIFLVKKGKIIPEIVMNIHNSKITNEFILDTNNLESKEYTQALYDNDKIVNLVDLIKCDNENKWFVYYQKGKKSYVSIISNNGKSRNNYSKSDVSNKDGRVELFIPEKFVGYDNGYLIGYLDSEAFSYMEDSKKSKYLDFIKKHSTNAPNNDMDIVNYNNLILCLYKIQQ